MQNIRKSSIGLIYILFFLVSNQSQANAVCTFSYFYFKACISTVEEVFIFTGIRCIARTPVNIFSSWKKPCLDSRSCTISPSTANIIHEFSVRKLVFQLCQVTRLCCITLLKRSLWVILSYTKVLISHFDGEVYDFPNEVWPHPWPPPFFSDSSFRL